MYLIAGEWSVQWKYIACIDKPLIKFVVVDGSTYSSFNKVIFLDVRRHERCVKDGWKVEEIGDILNGNNIRQRKVLSNRI